jgi:hypothetical protein
MTSMTDNIPRVRHNLEKFIDNALTENGVKFLDNALALAEDVIDDGDAKNRQILLAMLQTYTERFICVCKNTVEEPNPAVFCLQHLLKSMSPFNGNEHLLDSDTMANLNDIAEEITQRLPQQERRLTRKMLAKNFLALPEEDQAFAIPLLKELGIDTKPLLEAKKRQQQKDKEISIQNSLKMVMTRMMSGQDDEFIELVSKRVGEMSGFQLETGKIREFLTSFVRLTVVAAGEADTGSSGDEGKSIGSGNTRVYTYGIEKYGIKARMVIRDGLYVVLKGSTASGMMNDSMADGHRRKREELIHSGKLVRQGKTDLYVFISDVIFNSPSAASGVVSGSSTNGWVCFGIPRP